MEGHPRQMGHGGEFWQHVVHWRREWQTTSVFLPWEPHAAAAAAKSLQSCLTLFNPIDGSPPGSTVPGILQARTLEWVAISFSNAWKWKVKVKSLSHLRLLATSWTAAHQAPLSMGFSRQEYWSGVPSPSPWTCWDLFNYLTSNCNFQTSWFAFKNKGWICCPLVSFNNYNHIIV